MLLHSAAIHLLRTVRKADEAAGLTPQRLSAMSVVVFGGATTLGDLAAAEHVAPPTMTRLVQALEHDGFLTRTVDPDDRRSVRLAATARGARVLKQAQQRRVRLVAALIDRMTVTEFRALAVAVPALQRVLLADIHKTKNREEAS
jgi:DNA-binding MarR family transcriptional regulator